jgi:hypothetical protein
MTSLDIRSFYRKISSYHQNLLEVISELNKIERYKSIHKISSISLQLYQNKIRKELIPFTIDTATTTTKTILVPTTSNYQMLNLTKQMKELYSGKHETLMTCFENDI